MSGIQEAVTEILQNRPAATALFEVTVNTLGFVLMILLFGALYTFVGKRACRNIQRVFGTGVFLAFSCIGTTVHELSHYLACLLFRHKVVRVVLFSPSLWRSTGVLGVVEHRYNTRNLYQRAGNFLIGTAPLFSGAGVSWLILRMLGVEMNFSFSDGPGTFTQLLDLCCGVFTQENTKNPLFWLLLFVLVNLFLHVSLSAADLRNAATGLFFFVLLVLLLCGAISLFGIPFHTITEAMAGILSSLFFVLTFGFLIDLVILTVTEILLHLKRVLL